MKNIIKKNIININININKKVPTFLFSILLFVLPLLPDIIKDIADDKLSLQSIINWNGITSILLALVPWYLRSMLESNKDVLDNLRKAMEKQELAINMCPKMIALHTEENVLEEKIEVMSKLKKPNLRWLMSKYISKLLTISVKDFVIKIDASAYSKFSSSLIRDSIDSVKLTGSMRPYDWLSALGTNPDNKSKFFNSQLKLGDLIVDSDNHSIVLTQCKNIKNRKRIVCFNNYDWRYLFLSEISIDEYFCINGRDYSENNLQTYFANYSGGSFFNPIKYEYALYDDALLLKWDRKDEILSIIIEEKASYNERKEFEAVKNIFSDMSLEGRLKLYTYNDVKEEVKHQKIRLIKDVISTARLPHKLTYLYQEGGGNWIDYIDDEDSIYSYVASDVMKMGIRSLIEDDPVYKENVKLVELGPGDGSRSHVICDCFGIERIESYELIDISDYLLDKAHKNLELRLKNKVEKIQLDWTDSAMVKKLKKEGKIIFIPYNSTLFTEESFNWKSLNKYKRAIISLDIYDENIKDDLLDNYINAYKLLLHPLKIFEIPIDENYIEEHKRSLFEARYDKENCTYNVYFKLKHYLSSITDIDRSFDAEYKSQRNELKQIEELLVMSSLKFDNKDAAELYFKTKGFNPIIKQYDKYMIISLLK